MGVEKTPDVSVTLLTALFPAVNEMGILLVMRHPLCYHFEGGRPPKDADLGWALALWENAWGHALNVLMSQSSATFMLLRMEDFLHNPEEFLSAMSNAFGLAYK